MLVRLQNPSAITDEQRICGLSDHVREDEIAVHGVEGQYRGGGEIGGQDDVLQWVLPTCDYHHQRQYAFWRRVPAEGMVHFVDGETGLPSNHRAVSEHMGYLLTLRLILQTIHRQPIPADAYFLVIGEHQGISAGHHSL